jgi:hypothetical protein
MRFNEFNITEAAPINYQVPPSMRQQTGTQTPDWVAKSALNQRQDPVDIAQQETPAYQRKNVPQPPMRPQPANPAVWTNPRTGMTSNTPPVAGPKVWKDPRTGVVSNRPPPMDAPLPSVPVKTAKATSTPATPPIDNVGITRPGAAGIPPNTNLGKLGKVTPGEPTMGQPITNQPRTASTAAPAPSSQTAISAKYRQNALDVNGQPNQPRSTTPPPSISPSDRYRQNGMDNTQSRAGATQTPTTSPTNTTTANTATPSALDQATNTLKNIRKNMGKSMGNEYTNIYPAVGPTSFQNQQYIKDLEKELAKTPNDPTIKAELDKMRGTTSPSQQTPAAAPVAPQTKPVTPQQNAPTQQTPAPTQQTPAPTQQTPAPTQQTPAPSTSTGYKGSTGSQAIQQLNPDRITDVNKIYAGDTINLPGGGTYTIKQGDTLDQIARNQSAPAASAETPATVLTPKSTDVEKLPTEKVKETADDKSLNRIKSLAGLK